MDKDQNRNIVFIVIDTHRKDRLGMYGYPRKTSQNLDRFASKATLFENAISPAQWTIPAHASMFSGEYPVTHLTTQSGHSLDPYFRTIAEWLGLAGYQRIGFCNNPLVGVLDNGLKRGFDTFYNYGGAFPSTPARDTDGILNSLSQIWERYTQLLRRISYPIQNAVARSEKILNLSLNPLFVPLWINFANFKGNTIASIEDAASYLRTEIREEQKKPHFVFVNLMETHLPFTPPESFVEEFVPYLAEERAARDFMRVYNTKALRWLLPMEEPFSELESKTLSDFYDAEVAYQDYLINQLLTELETPYHRENTMVIVVADHGEMLGENNFMGHSFRVYPELIDVPLIIRFAGQAKPFRIPDYVSTTQLFYTVLEYANIQNFVGCESERERTITSEIKLQSLLKYKDGDYSCQKEVFSEAYPPENVIKILESYNPGLIEKFAVRSLFQAAYSQQGFKLTRGDGFLDALYRRSRIPNQEFLVEESGKTDQYPLLVKALEAFMENGIDRQPKNWRKNKVNIDNELVKQRLRNLGYLE